MSTVLIVCKSWIQRFDPEETPSIQRRLYCPELRMKHWELEKAQVILRGASSGIFDSVEQERVSSGLRRAYYSFITECRAMIQKKHKEQGFPAIAA
jgi:hypothetical protein